MTVKTDFVYNSYFFRKKILKIDLFLHSLNVSTPLILLNDTLIRSLFNLLNFSVIPQTKVR